MDAFELTILSKDPSIDAKAVVGKPLAVGFRLASGWRYFHGVVGSFAKIGATMWHTRYRAELVPKLSLCKGGCPSQPMVMPGRTFRE